MTGRLLLQARFASGFLCKNFRSKLLQPRSIDCRTFLARRSTRNVVLNAGSKLFIELCLNACGVQDITDAAGVPKGSFYNHFKSKEALAAEVLAEYGKGTTDRSILSNGKIPPLARL